MAQQTLDQRFANGPPSRGEGESHRRMTSTEHRYILWGIKEGWSAARIGRSLGVNEATVRRFRAKFTKDPAVLLQLGLFEIVGRARDDEYRCLVCGDQIVGRSEIERHIRAHFLDEIDAAEAPRDAASPDRVVGSEANEQPDVESAPYSASPAATPQVGAAGDMESLVSQIRSNPALAKMLSDALDQVARNEREVQAAPEEDSRPELESLTLDQARLRRPAETHDHSNAGLGDDNILGDAIVLPPPEIVYDAAPPAWITADEEDALGPPERRGLTEPSPDELAESRKRREAFERLKAQAAEHQSEPVVEPEIWEPPSPPVEPPPIHVPAEEAPVGGLAPAEVEAEIRRAAFKWVQDEKVDDPADDSQESDSKAEQQRHELESILGESITAAPDAPGVDSDTPTASSEDSPDDAASIADDRRAEFERFRLGMDAGVRETVSPYKTEDANDEIETPGGVWPAGPAEDPESQDWHNAFERLASERGKSDDLEAPEVVADPGQTDPAGVPTSDEDGSASPGPEDDDLDLGSWHDAFQKLTAERGSTDAEPDAPPQQEPSTEEVDDGLTTTFEPETLGDSPGSQAGTTEVDDDSTSTFPVAEGAPDEGAARLEELARLQQQVSEPDEPPPSSESALRMAEFERLRQEALEGGPPAAQTPPEPASATDTDAILGGHGLPTMPPDEAAAAMVADATLEGTELDAPPGVVTAAEPDEMDVEEEAGDARRSFGLGSLGGRVSLAAWGMKGRELFSRISTSKPVETTSIAVEHGFIKLLVTRGMDVLDYRIVPANPVLFREGMISDASRMAALLKRALQDLDGDHRRVVAAVPGYQTNLRRIELPNVRRMDPKVAIPSEARRTMGVSPENSHLSWRPLPGAADSSNWLVVSATNRSVSSISAMADGAGVSMKALELRPFAVARATNQPDAVFAWTAADGCDAVVVRDWVPMTYQSAYWGAGSEVQPPDLVNRITEVVESTIAAHNVEAPDLSVSKDMPLFVYGSPTGRDESVGVRVAQNLGMATQEPEIPLNIPDGFPVRELIVNIGLSLWED